MKDLSSDEYRSLADFRYQIRRFLGFSEEHVRAAGMEPQQHQLLLAIKGLPDGAMATIGELAERLQLKPSTIYELTRRRKQHPLPYLKAGKFLRFRWSEIEQWLSESRRAA